MTCWVKEKQKNGEIYMWYVLCADGDFCTNPLWILGPPASPDYIIEQILDEQQTNYK